MARKNKFLEQNTDFVAMMNEETAEDNLTKTIVRELDEQSDLDQNILTAPADRFIPYKDKKLRLDLYHGEDRERLKESIQLNGIFTPVICVKKDDKFMILSGHNRVDIAKELNIEVPYILKKDLSDEEMNLICVDDNLVHRQRNDYKPMQLAYSIKVKMDAEKHQGRTLSTGYSKYTGDKIGDEHGLSRKMINIYLKLNDLSDEVKKRVDDKTLAVKAAYELAFLDQDFQNILMDYIEKYKINIKKIQEIRRRILEEEFLNQDDKVKFIEEHFSQLCVPGTQSRRFHFENIRQYIPKEIKDESAEEYIIEALKFYNKNRK